MPISSTSGRNRSLKSLVKTFELDYPTDLAARLQQQIQQLITTRQPLKDETLYTSAFGTRAYEYIFVPLFGTDGAVEQWQGPATSLIVNKLKRLCAKVRALSNAV